MRSWTSIGFHTVEHAGAGFYRLWQVEVAYKADFAEVGPFRSRLPDYAHLRSPRWPKLTVPSPHLATTQGCRLDR